jgi:hypothetical protein
MSLVGRIQEREVCSDPAQPQHWIKLTCHKESFPEFPHTTSCPLRQACQLLSPHDKLPHAAIQDTTLCVNGTTVHWNIFPFYLRVSLTPCPLAGRQLSVQQSTDACGGFPSALGEFPAVLHSCSNATFLQQSRTTGDPGPNRTGPTAVPYKCQLRSVVLSLHTLFQAYSSCCFTVSLMTRF